MDGRYGASLCEIEIGIVVPSVIYAPVWLADQRGFLRDQGLTVRLRSFGSTDATTAGLRDGAVPVTIGSPEGSIANALIGGDLRLVSGFVNRPPLSMIAQPRYHSMSDLRGAKLGTTSLKEGTCHLMEKMMAAHGMHQPADFQFVMAGAHPQRWEALKAVTLDAAIQLVPFNYIAEELRRCARASANRARWALCFRYSAFLLPLLMPMLNAEILTRAWALSKKDWR